MNLKSPFVIHGALVVAALLGAGTTQAGDVSVSVGVNLPGVYGQINIGGGIPAPELLLPQPMVAMPPPVVVGIAPPPPPPPMYLHVPPGYEKHWRKHCRQYNACGRPVYFVSDQWYNNVYVPHRARYHDDDQGWDGDHDHDRGHRDHDDHDRGKHRGHDDHDHGRGHGDHDDQ